MVSVARLKPAGHIDRQTDRQILPLYYGICRQVEACRQRDRHIQKFTFALWYLLPGWSLQTNRQTHTKIYLCTMVFVARLKPADKQTDTYKNLPLHYGIWCQVEACKQTDGHIQKFTFALWYLSPGWSLQTNRQTHTIIYLCTMVSVARLKPADKQTDRHYLCTMVSVARLKPADSSWTTVFSGPGSVTTSFQCTLLSMLSEHIAAVNHYLFSNNDVVLSRRIITSWIKILMEISLLWLISK